MKLKKRILLSLAALSVTAAASAAGPQVYGYQMGDETYRFGFISFPADNLAGLSLVQSASSDTYVGAGEYVDGKYYTFTVYYDAYFEGGVVTDTYCVYDVNEDGTKYTLSKEIDKYGDLRVTDMAFDYTTNTMYAIGESKKADSGKIGTTELYIVDLETGDLALVGGPGDITAQDGYGRTVHENIIAIACSPEGQLYGMGEYRQLYKLDKYTGLATATGARHRIAVDNDYQSMAFTPDGKLYHAQKHPDYEYFMRIDPATGKLYNPQDNTEVTVDASFNNTAARFKNDPQVTGIYFKGHQVVASSPLAPRNLTAILRSGTSNTVDLTWTLPTANYGGTAPSISNVVVYRIGDANPLATLAGTATSYTDTNAPNGDVMYYVTTVSGGQYGFPALAKIFSGADQLKAVGNLRADLSGSKVTLSWTAPTATVNGGYADYDNITYIVNQIAGSTVKPLAADLTATTYETEIAEAGTFSFEVIPVTCGVKGLSTTSNSVTIEKSSSIPYFSGFEDDEDGTLWTVINPMDGSYGWSIELPPYTYQRYDGKGAKFYTGGSSTFPADTWLVSPPIYMEPGIYSISYMALGGSFDTHTFDVAIGTSATDASAFTDVLASHKEALIYNEEEGNVNHFQDYEHEFTIETAGEYYVGFHGVGNAIYATLRIDNVAIDKIADLPGAALSLPYTTSFEPEEENQWTYLNNDNAPNQGWSIQKTSGVSKAYDGDYYAQFKTASNYPLDAWMISPALSMPAGDYILTFMVDGSSYDTQTFDVLLGTDASDASSFTQTLKSYDDVKLYDAEVKYVAETIEFKVESDGTYYLGFCGKGNTIYATMKIDKIILESGKTNAVGNILDGNSSDSDLLPVYYDLQGRLISHPEIGQIYIVRIGNKVYKQIYR